MTTMLTPPPVPPAAAEYAPAPNGPTGPTAASRVIAILAIVLGATVVLGTAFSAVTSTIASAVVRSETRSISPAVFTNLDVDLSAGTLAVVFVDGQQDARLEVTNAAGADAWTFTLDDGTLTVASPDHRFGPLWLFGGTERAVLRLPADMQLGQLQADVRVSAGDLSLSGQFSDLDLTLGAGRATVTGSASALSMDVSAGAADLDLGNVSTAELSVSAGAVTTRFTGTQPESIDADVSAGSLNMRVPAGDYDIRPAVTAGRFDNRIPSFPGAYGTITVQLSAGTVTLRAG